jgi:hypothetical protein
MGINMGLFKKKRTPEELKAKVSMAEKKFSNKEKDFTRDCEKAKRDAKRALEKNDDRAYRIAAKKYTMSKKQSEFIAGLGEIATNVKYLIEAQKGIGEVMEMAQILTEAQKDLGIDNKGLEESITKIMASNEKVNATAEVLSMTIDSMTTNEETEAEESLRDELMAELKAEKSTKSKFDKEIKAEMEEDAEK